MPKIYLYAEVLTHLRQLTLHASLETEKNEETKIEVSSDKKIITVIHDGESSSLYLPTQISGTAQVTFPLDKKTEISARVQIEDLEQWKETDAAGIEAPWNASELSFESCMACVGCDTEVLSMGTISSWKDLPTQHWAEVMDLWFCHKPHEHSNENQEQEAAEAKGFSAQSKLASKPGVGMVDMVSFAIHPDDCSNIKIVSTENTNDFKPVSVLCTRCRQHIGSFSSIENLVRFQKASLKVKSSRDQPFISFPATTFISAELLEIVESTAIRKVIVYCPTHEPASNPSESATISPETSIVDNDSTSAGAVEPAVNTTAQPTSNDSTKSQEEDPEPEKQTGPLLLWIFNPDIYYSSSRLTTSSRQNKSNTTTTTTNEDEDDNNTSAPSTSPLITTNITLPHRAQKIFYRPLTPSETTTHLSSPSAQYEHLPIPSPTHLASLHATLQSSTAMLPATARVFNDFAVGLLDRYERHGSAERVMEGNPLARGVEGELAADGRGRVTRWELPRGAHELYL